MPLLPEESETSPRESRLAQFWDGVGSRILFFVASGVLAVGAVVLLVTLLKEDTPSGPLPAAPTFDGARKPTSAIDPAARKVAGEFILTAVARKNVGRSWDLVHPSMRAGFTRAQWAKGEIPVIFYPVDNIDEARFSVEALQKNMIQLDVALLPKDASQTAGVFKIGLVAVGTGDRRRWLVDYWGSAGAPGFRKDPR